MLFEFCVIHTRDRECLLFSFSAQLLDPLLVEHCTLSLAIEHTHYAKHLL